MSKNKVVLFGFGGIADQAISYYSQEYEILCYIDKDSQKWGVTKQGIGVYGPSKLDGLEYDKVVITSMYYPEIRRQLLERGIKSSKIAVFPDNPNFRKLFFSLPISIVMTPVNFLNFFRSAIAHLQKFKPSLSNLPPLPGVYLFAINTLFWMYSTEQSLKNGLAGVSKCMGAGNYQLSNLWFNVPLSQILFRFFGTYYSVISVLLLPLTFAFQTMASPGSFFVLIFLMFSSPISHSIAFVTGRYHSAAWIFFCLFILYHNDDNFILCSISFLAISLLSSTVLLLTVISSMALIMSSTSIFMPTTMVPGILYIAIHLLYIFARSSNFSSTSLLNTFKGIGAIKKNVKYERKIQGLSVTDKFLSIIYFPYFYFFYHSFSDFPILSAVACATLIFNSIKLRFLDTQTAHFFLFLSLLIEFSLAGFQPLHATVILPFCLLPTLFKTGSTSNAKPIRVFRPIDLNPEINMACRFLEPIPPDSRVLVLFKDPCGSYEKLLDGFRESLELLLYAGIKKNLVIFPNWQVLFQNNKIKDSGFWINSEHTLASLANLWNFDYVIYDKFDFKNEVSSHAKISRNKFISTIPLHDKWSRMHLVKPSWEIAKL